MSTADYIQISIACGALISIVISVIAMKKNAQQENRKECKAMHEKIHASDVVDAEIRGELSQLRTEVRAVKAGQAEVCGKLNIILEKIL